jgi:pyruvate/2-oxoglutarate dehydrogenase complex dihydrolipoamide dehydrogenase (E3) component
MISSRGLATESKPYDLAVIGGGPGGYVAAIKAAQQGLKVCHFVFSNEEKAANLEYIMC